MQLKLFSLAAFVAAVAGQTQNLNDALAGNEQTSDLVGFLERFPELLQSLNEAQDITLLAPSNDAFRPLLESDQTRMLLDNPDMIQALLQYHVLNGTFAASAITNTSSFVPTLLTNETYTNVTDGQVVEAVLVQDKVLFFSGLLQNSTVVEPDLNFTGGVIHVIDRVLTIPQNVSSTATAAGLTALAGALNQTDSIEEVDTAEDVTIFAPSNEAFQAIGSAVGELSPEQLTDILRYHVIQGTVAYSTDLQNDTTLTTVEGQDVTVRILNGTVFVNNAKVVLPNVLVANGVVHVIDNVLNPGSIDATPSPSATAGAAAFSGASSVADVPFTSGQATPTTTLNSVGGQGAVSSAATATSTAGAMPMVTGAVGAAALFGAGAAVLNL